MKIKGLLLLSFMLLTFFVFAQEKKTRGYQGIVEIGGGVYHDLNSESFGGGFLNADFINGYKFNHSVSVGLGIGVRYLGGYEQLAPVLYGTFRANLGYNRFEKVYPYIQTGLGFPVLKQSIGIGFKNSPFTISLDGEYFVPVFAIGALGGYNSIGIHAGISF